MSPTAAVKRQPDLTRQKLLDCAFEEIHKNGFRAASLDAILENSGVTKGALYHHFANKAELGYAVVDEIVRPFVEEKWQPVRDADNPVDAAIQVILQRMKPMTERVLSYGCPFNNLCNEMSPVDEGFRTRLNGILDDWRAGIGAALRRGQTNGTVRKDVSPEATAALVISSIEGCVGMAKASRSQDFLYAGMRGLIEYLERLRPSHRPSPGAPAATT